MNRTESTKCWRNFLNELGGSNDRVSIIVAVAEMDSRLTSVLRASLLPVGKNDDDDSLFGSDRPLSSFSARIHLAYRLGLIDDSFARALHLIRKMRNEFAHATMPGCISTLSLLTPSPREARAGRGPGRGAFRASGRPSSPLSIAAVAAPPSEGGEGARFRRMRTMSRCTHNA